MRIEVDDADFLTCIRQSFQYRIGHSMFTAESDEKLTAFPQALGKSLDVVITFFIIMCHERNISSISQ